MKYTVTFTNGTDEKELSFDILDTPAANAWASVMQEALADESASVVKYGTTFPSLPFYEHVYYHQLRNAYVNYKHVFDETDLVIPERFDYTVKDLLKIKDEIYNLYIKSVVNEEYKDKGEVFVNTVNYWVKQFLIFVENQINTLVYKNENFLKLTMSNSRGKYVPVDDEIRNTFIETPRPNLVLRLDPGFILKSLETAYAYNNPELYTANKHDKMVFVGTHHKICYYTESLTQSDANKQMKRYRNGMLNFAVENYTYPPTGKSDQYLYAMPVIGHSSDTIEPEDLASLFRQYEVKSITLV